MGEMTPWGGHMHVVLALTHLYSTHLLPFCCRFRGGPPAFAALEQRPLYERILLYGQRVLRRACWS